MNPFVSNKHSLVFEMQVFVGKKNIKILQAYQKHSLPDALRKHISQK
jgi:hypothetical protein